MKVKPFSLGAICFIYLPLLGVFSTLLYFGFRYWYLTLAFLFFMVIVRASLNERAYESNVHQDEEINRVLDTYAFKKIKLLKELGRPADNGRWSEGQQAVWNHIQRLDRAEEAFRSKTEVILLHPAGSRVGKVYKK